MSEVSSIDPTREPPPAHDFNELTLKVEQRAVRAAHTRQHAADALGGPYEREWLSYAATVNHIARELDNPCWV